MDPNRLKEYLTILEMFDLEIPSWTLFDTWPKLDLN